MTGHSRNTVLAPRSRRFWIAVEVIAWFAGVVCLSIAGVRFADSVTGSRQALQDFSDMRAKAQLNPASVLAQPETPDLTLWSPQRIAAWQRASILPRPTPLAVLRVPRIHLEVAVLEGTDDATLNRAVGHIQDTAAPGMDGNSGLAGHRDGFFRGLMDVVPGDTIELETLQGTDTYRIQRTWIVEPEDVSVLDPTPTRSLTLVTCYPFYFVGSAPQRYIVRAVGGESLNLTTAATLGLSRF